MTRAYYNENDPKAAAWLRELVKDGHIASGDVDERSIEDVTPNELAEYRQCHFFAGIGGWSYALRLADWPDDRAVWTGSCPCQPFSAAGKKAGFADERHLWPAWFHLIHANKPQLIFGEQVTRAMQWVDLVQRDVEAEGYTFGSVILGAHSVGAPHVRQRLYWMANSLQSRREGCNPKQRFSRGATKAFTIDSNPFADSWRALYGNTEGLQRDDGISGRVGLVRGYGNAIVPQVAATFIKATGCV